MVIGLFLFLMLDLASYKSMCVVLADKKASNVDLILAEHWI